MLLGVPDRHQFLLVALTLVSGVIRFAPVLSVLWSSVHPVGEEMLP